MFSARGYQLEDMKLLGLEDATSPPPTIRLYIHVSLDVFLPGFRLWSWQAVLHG